MGGGVTPPPFLAMVRKRLAGRKKIIRYFSIKYVKLFLGIFVRKFLTVN